MSLATFAAEAEVHAIAAERARHVVQGLSVEAVSVQTLEERVKECKSIAYKIFRIALTSTSLDFDTGRGAHSQAPVPALYSMPNLHCKQGRFLPKS